MPRTPDQRPPVAIGHVFLRASDVAAATEWLTTAGLRRIAGGKSFAVLELRGGTHLVVTKAARPPKKGTEAPFDLMVDDVDAARRAYAKHGFKPTRIKRGTIHDRFTVAGPDGYRFEIVSSHAGKRPV
ncbi:MAG TPA: VOC family protein [Stellaceae bacterium]|nr:VOC family protein [Stellaceae bacterium]